MSTPRFGTRGLMLIVVAAAVGFAALCNPGYLWSQVLYTFTVGLLLASILGAIKGRHRTFWLGFAIIGWGLFIVNQLPSSRTLTPPEIGRRDLQNPRMLQSTFFDFLYAKLHGISGGRGGPRPPTFDSLWSLSAYLRQTQPFYPNYFSFHEIADSLTCLAVAVLGGITAVWLDRRRQAPGAGSPQSA